MGQAANSCVTTVKDTRPIIKMSKSSDLIFAVAQAGLGTEKEAKTKVVPQTTLNGRPDPSNIDEICVGPEKIVCEWGVHPNEAVRGFEQYGPTTGYRPLIENNESYPENLARCGTGKTYQGICEDWLTAVGPNAAHIDPEAITMFDRGICSAQMPLDFALTLLLYNFKKQANERLGNDQRDPQGQDVILWTDFVYGLEKGDESQGPFRAWADWSVVPAGPFETLTIGEVIIEGNYRVNGDLEWRFDPERYGSSTAGQILAVSLQSLWYLNPSLFWTVFLGDCDKHRPLRMQFRGELAASENGGLGIKINDSDTCGPNGDGPCTWAAIKDWPGPHPICNNRIKPQIQDNFVAGIKDGMVNRETGKPFCLSCTEDGGSILSYKLKNGDPIPIVRVVTDPSEVTLVFVDDLNDPDQLAVYNELFPRGMCSGHRVGANSEYAVPSAGGVTL